MFYTSGQKNAAMRLLRTCGSSLTVVGKSFGFQTASDAVCLDCCILQRKTIVLLNLKAYDGVFVFELLGVASQKRR